MVGRSQTIGNLVCHPGRLKRRANLIVFFEGLDEIMTMVCDLLPQFGAIVITEHM